LDETIRARIVLENDDVSWSIEDLICICEKLSIPLVLDHHHDSIISSPHPLSTYLPRVDALFARRGIRPKQHLSEPANPLGTPSKRREHAYLVSRLPRAVDNWDGDLMIEAKGKEKAVLALARKYGLWEVSEEWDVARNKKYTEEQELTTKAKRECEKRKMSSADLVADMSMQPKEALAEDLPAKRARRRRPNGEK
ncbi:hypothetical protein HDU93_005937, partial [Gonapodya sp. JEL0774]